MMNGDSLVQGDNKLSTRGKLSWRLNLGCDVGAALDGAGNTRRADISFCVETRAREGMAS